MSDTTRAKRSSKKGHKRTASLVFVLLLALLLFVLIVMFINSRKPGFLAQRPGDPKIKGTYFIKTNLALIEQMHENWLPNDLFWPTIFLDNMPNFQIGQLEVVRYNVRVLRDNLSRMRTTDKLDPYAEAAFTALSNDPLSYDSLQSFYENLLKGDSNFYPRADNLVTLLNQYLSLMGGANTRLINAPGDIKRTLSIEKDKEGQRLVDIDIPWSKIDDNFYYAQGIGYALYESFRAIKIDFKDVLLDKNSMELVDKILEDLKR
jgi:hypothetical protein